MGRKYQIIRRNATPVSNQLSEITQRLYSITASLASIWAVLQANGYQTNNYTGYTVGYSDYSGYDFTGYTGAAMSLPDGSNESIPGPVGSGGQALGGAIASNTPPHYLLPEIDHLEEPRYS